MVEAQTAPFPGEEWELPSCGGHDGGESDAVSPEQHVGGGVLLGFLGLPLASAFAQLLLGFEG